MSVKRKLKQLKKYPLAIFAIGYYSGVFVSRWNRARLEGNV